MSSSKLIEVLGHMLFSFTRGVTEHYNPQEPEYTAESFGYSPLESTGREWYRHGDPDEEIKNTSLALQMASLFELMSSRGTRSILSIECSTGSW